VGSRNRAVVPGFVVLLSLWLLATTPDALSGAALAGPLEYANANGAFFVQASIASLMLFAAWRSRSAKLAALLATAVLSLVVFSTKSVAAIVLLILLPVTCLPIAVWRRAQMTVVVCTALFVAALGTTVALGATYSTENRVSVLDHIVDSTLDQRRVALWHEALQMMLDNPGKGVGIARFQALSPTAGRDRDARWTHNGFLQQGAETGVTGLLLTVLMFMWAFVSLSRIRADTFTVLGGIALAALAIHACVDYVLHFPQVVMVTAALVGTAMASPSRAQERAI
jgi:O-antigen ligase